MYFCVMRLDYVSTVPVLITAFVFSNFRSSCIFQCIFVQFYLFLYCHFLLAVLFCKAVRDIVSVAI